MYAKHACLLRVGHACLLRVGHTYYCYYVRNMYMRSYVYANLCIQLASQNEEEGASSSFAKTSFELA